MSKPKKPDGVAVSTVEMCKCEGCKKTSARFSFCEAHYDWFKFGLVNKEGKKVLDFEKKWGHFEAMQARVAKKAA